MSNYYLETTDVKNVKLKLLAYLGSMVTVYPQKKASAASRLVKNIRGHRLRTSHLE